MSNTLRVALVHDYLHEYGGAERVLEALCEMYPRAPIYTAFLVRDSVAAERFRGKKIVESWAARIPGFKRKLHSPFRFLAPLIWSSFDFSGFDVVISSSSWYMTKGIVVPKNVLHVSYVHTPPRYLYGYATSVNYRKNRLITIYAGIVNTCLRQYDYETAQKVDVLIANSQEVRRRIKKFWRRESRVIYPPVSIKAVDSGQKENYLLTGGRLVGPKHFDVVIRAANELKLNLKVFGSGPEEKRLRHIAGSTIEFLGKVDEPALARLYSRAKGFIALADDEDFGITPVEAEMAGTPVLAYRGGGYTESVVEGKTGVFVEDLSVKAVVEGLQQLGKHRWNVDEIQQQGQKFSKSRFVKEIKQLVDQEWKKKHAGIT